MIGDNGAKKLIELFESEGHTAYAVGGCVRDILMRRPVSDYDIAVSTPPDITESVLEKHSIRFFETGLKHGTVTAIIEGKAYELTSFRADGDYTDNRRPDSVSFVSSIEEDLARRDFTVNAMAYSPKSGLVDLFGGSSDIRYRVIRTVGDADTRFHEDALRILRGIRFASVLGFEIEDATFRSILKNAPLLKNIARERITAEVQKTLTGGRAGEMLCDCAKVFCIICPDFSKIYEKHASAYIRNVVNRSPADADIRFTLFCILACDGETDKKSEILARIFGCFRFKNETKAKIEALVMNSDANISQNRISLKKHMSRIGVQNLLDLIAVKSVLCDTDLSGIVTKVNEIISSGEAYTVSQLALTGSDLKALGMNGRQIGETLQKILHLVMENKLPNDKEIILNHIKKTEQRN